MAGGLKRGLFGESLIEIGIFSAATNALLLVMPLYLLQIYDRVLPASSMSTLIYITHAGAGRAGRARACSRSSAPTMPTGSPRASTPRSAPTPS